MNKESLILKIEETISIHDHVAQVHRDYDRVNELATLYSQIISGKDIDCLLKQFVRREDKVMFDQRKTLTQQITPAISSTIIKTFNKVFRTTPATEVIDFDSESPEKDIEAIKESLKKIYGNKDLYKYLQDMWLYYSFVDPNAFVYTTFDDFDAKVELPRVYNQEITSAQAINYEYIGNELQWLITKTEIFYLEQEKETKGYIYIIYGPEFAYSYTQVGSDHRPEDNEDIVKIEISDKHYEYYIAVEHEHKSKVIPLIQVGYERDTQTEGRTFVSPIEAGMPYFMKTIKTVSEFDLTMCLHAFPKLFQYVEKCALNVSNGKCLESQCAPSACEKCNKTGMKTHGSAQDAIFLKLPTGNVTNDDLLDLSKMIHVETPDIALLEFQDTIIDKYELKIIRSVFNSDRFKKEEVAKTATGENVDMQNVYDTLKPFAEKLSDMWEHIVTVTAYYLDKPNVIVAHAYPNDFKFKTVSQLLSELNAATTGGASGYVISGIESDIVRQMYIDAPLEYQKYLSKQKFFPFKGKTKDEVQSILMSSFVREDDVILYNYFETIFSELEEEYLVNSIWFYDLTYDLQKAAIKEKIEEIKEGIGGAVELDMTAVS